MPSSMISPADTLKDEHQAAASLLQLLEKEQAQLIGANIEELSALTEEKAGIVEKMTKLAERRHQTLAAAGLTANEAGMQTWLKNTAKAADTQKLWNDLLALARSAKELNRLNGLLIAQYMARNQVALHTLHAPAQGSHFYGPDGQATARTTTRSLVVG